MEKTFSSIQHMDNLSIGCMEKFSICRIDKDMSEDTEQVHNVYIDMIHIRKNVAPTGNNFSLT